METFGIYRFDDNKSNKTGYYIGLMKRKIKESIKEHKGEILRNTCNNIQKAQQQ